MYCRSKRWLTDRQNYDYYLVYLGRAAVLNSGHKVPLAGTFFPGTKWHTPSSVVLVRLLEYFFSLVESQFTTLKKCKNIPKDEYIQVFLNITIYNFFFCKIVIFEGVRWVENLSKLAKTNLRYSVRDAKKTIFVRF